MTTRTGLFVRAVVSAAALAVVGGAQAVVLVTGDVAVGPTFAALGPGDTVLPDRAAWVGAKWQGSGVGSLLVDGGSFLSLAHLAFGVGGTGAVGTGSITGTGTQVRVLGDGASRDQVQRLQIGNFGNGELTVSGGALLDTRGNQAPCLLAFHYCDSFVGSAAGDNAVLNVVGTGTRVNIGQNLFVAQPGLAIQHLDGYTLGIPGGTTRGTVNVSDGAVLSTDRAQVGPRHWSTNATGFERNLAEVNVSGAGSRWVVTGGQTVLNHATGQVGEAGASIATANDSNAWATINVSNGGVIEVQGTNDVYNYVNLTAGGTSRSGLAGGRTDMQITGAGSQLLFTSQAGVLQVGRARGTANLLVSEGGSVDGAYYLSVGRDGASGNLSIDGAGSFVRLNNWVNATANASGAINALAQIGRGGSGTVTVSNGGQLLIEGRQFLTGGTALQLGVEADSSGTLNIDGAGSLVRIQSFSAVAGGGPGEARNPHMSVGRDGSGVLNISNGGKLVLDGGGVSTPADRRSTSFYVGGFSDTAIGGKGIATVSGSGSEIRVLGGDSFIGVGVGAQSSGQLSVSAGAAVNGMGMAVGRSGGVGVLKVDSGTLNFSGQQTAGNQSGAFFVIGSGGTGIGLATLANGSTVTLNNMGSAGAGVSIGGSGAFAGGEGSLTMTGGSRIELHSQPGLNSFTVGREGSGFVRLRGASSIDQVDGVMQIGRDSGSDGTVILSEGSSIRTGWLGVGAAKTATGNTDGGTGTFVLINSTLDAQQIVVGKNGFLGGTGTINGSVTNRGIFSPGNSPGTLVVNGGFVAEAGSRMILEVQANGSGGFITDTVVFGAGQPLNLAALKVEFRFLGQTDPTAFQHSGGFDAETFFQQQDGHGGTVALASAALAGVQYTAQSDAYVISNFSFDASTGANVFNAVPVPEPAAWLLLVAGLGLVGQRVRRRG